MSRSSVSSLRRTRISPSFSPVLFWSASARSSCSCVTRRSETSRSPKRLPTGAWPWPRGATVVAPTLASRLSSGPVSGGLGCSCRPSVLIASRLDPQTRCQPRGSGRVEGKQEFSQWRRRATGSPSGQFRCRVASFFSARLLAVALPLAAQYRHLLVERSADGFVVTVTLNRPAAMNAMNTAMGEDLLACFDGLLRDSLVRAVVFTGAGDRAFCAGGDLKERNEMTDEAWRAQHVIFEQAASRILKTPVPVIAAVEGFALAGGCELATLADFIVASETAVFGVPETTLGIFPGIGGTQLLPRILGAPLAKELIFTGRRMKADEAKAAGLVNHLVPRGGARAKALELAEAIARNGPIAVRQAKKAIAYGLETDLDARREYPEKFVNELTQAGYLAALIPQEYGGAGLGIVEGALILETIHAAGGNAAACHAQMYIMGTLLRHGSAEQKRRYLPKLAAGELRLQAFGVTEPNSGSDTTKLATTAVRRGDRYIVNGRKMFISRVLQSDLMLLLARTTPVDQVKRRTDGLSVFLVDIRNLTGLEVRPLRMMMNHSTNALFFDDVEIPADSLIGEEGAGFAYILAGMNAERILVGSESIGDGRWFVDKAVTYSSQRVVFGRPIGANQGVQFPIAKAHTAVEAAALMRDKAAALFDAGQPCGPE